MPEQRRQVLEAIQEERRGRDRVSEEQESLGGAVAKTRAQIGRYSLEVADIEDQKGLLAIQITQRETSLVARAADIMRRGLMRPSLADGLKMRRWEMDDRKYTAEINSLNLEHELTVVHEEYDRLQQDKEQFRQGAWQHLNSHYQEVLPRRDLLKLEQFKQEHGQIDTLSLEHTIYFVHGFTEGDKIVTEENNPLSKEMEYFGPAEKAAYIVQNDIEISASSVSPDANHWAMWSPVGVLLNGGQVQYASPEDIDTNIQPDGTRDTGKGALLKNIEDYRHALSRAIAACGARDDRFTYTYEGRTHQGAGYNEFVVKNPKVAAFYVAMTHGVGVTADFEGSKQADDSVMWRKVVDSSDNVEDITYKDIFDIAHQLEVPVFGRYPQEGAFRELSIDMETQQVIIGEVVSPQDIIELPSISRSLPQITQLSPKMTREEQLSVAVG